MEDIRNDESEAASEAAALQSELQEEDGLHKDPTDLEDGKFGHSSARLPTGVGEMEHSGVKESGITPGDKLWETREVVVRLMERADKSRLLFLWRLNATKSKASALAVWAVDQGNRKAYEVERALMAENSWATRSVIWEGYRHSPLVGLTDSGFHWSEEEGRDEKDAGKLGHELRLAKQRCGYLNAQLEAARQQLIDWQEVADFQSLDGRWHSTKVREMERQLKAYKVVHSMHLNHMDSPTAKSWTAEMSTEDHKLKSEKDRKKSMRSWMMGYESEREIRSTIPGLSTNGPKKLPQPDEDPQAGKAEVDLLDDTSGDFGDDRMRELLVSNRKQTLPSAKMNGTSVPQRGTETENAENTDTPAQELSELERAELKVKNTEKKYEELRAVAIRLEESLVETIAELELSAHEEAKLRQENNELRHTLSQGEHFSQKDEGQAEAKALPQKDRSVKSTQVDLITQHQNDVGIAVMKAAVAPAEGVDPGDDEVWCAEIGTFPRKDLAILNATMREANLGSGGFPTDAETNGRDGGVESHPTAAVDRAHADEEDTEDVETLRQQIKSLKQQLQRRTVQLQEAVAIGVGVEWVM